MTIIQMKKLLTEVTLLILLLIDVTLTIATTYRSLLFIKYGDVASLPGFILPLLIIGVIISWLIMFIMAITIINRWLNCPRSEVYLHELI